MSHRSNPCWTRLLVTVLVLAGGLLPAAAQAGNTHSEGGAVIEAAGVPETDGTATVQIYWTGDSAARTTTTVGATLAGYWLHDVGFALAREWQVGDPHIALLEMQTGAGTPARAGYYGVATKALTSLDPDAFPAMTVRPVPVPVAAAGGGYIDLTWNRAASAGGIAAIAGYNLYRSQNGLAFTKLNAAVLADTTYRDAAVTFGESYAYAVGLVYAGTPAVPGTAMSASSAPASPLDATPPDVPVLALLPPFTAGTQNTIRWSSTAASGATAYFAECALDSAFTSLLGSSGWIADSTHTFTGLADGSMYFYRVRARDAANNLSDFSAAKSSRQDATPPSSHLLALTAYKASSTVNLEWVASDSVSGVAGIQLYYSKDGGPATLYPGSPFTTSPIAFDAATTGGDGTYAFYTRALDAAANAEAAPEAPDATTIIDTQPPQAPVLAALPAFTAGTARSVAWSSAAASGAIEYRAQASLGADFAAIHAESGWLADTTTTFAGLEDGRQMHYRVQARDLAGNESAFGAAGTSTQDATPPATAADALPAYGNATALAIAWTGSDATSGLAGVELFYSKDGGPAAQVAGGPFATSPIAFDAATAGGDGRYAFYTLGTDAVGNTEAAPASADAETTIDTAAPGTPALAALPAYTSGTERALAWSGDADEYLAQAARDAAFADIAAESGWIAAATHTFTGLEDGRRYFFRVRGRDLAGNATVFSAAETSTQDATAPATQVEPLAAYSTRPAFAIAWTGSDATSGLAGVELLYSKDGGPATRVPGGPFTTSPIAFDAATTGGDGAYAFYTLGTDAAGNTEAAPASADAQTTIDTQAPGTPALVALPAYTAGTQRALAWSGDADEYLAQAARDAAFADIAAESGWMAVAAHTFTGLEDGRQYFFRVRGRDLAGNETAFSTTEASTQDATPPQSQLAALPAILNAFEVSLAWSGSDATSGLASVDLYYSKDGAPAVLYPGSPFAASPIAFDAALVGGDGHYTFYTRARDAAGNVEAAPATPDATTTIDTDIPEEPVLASLPEFTPGTARQLVWGGSDADTYLAQAARDAAFADIAAESGWIPETTYTFTGLEDGRRYFFRVRGRDQAGNLTAFSVAESSTQDATAPESQIAALPPFMNTTMLALAWSGSDATSGLTAVDLYYSKDGGPMTLHAPGPHASSPIAFDAAAAGGDGDYAFFTRAHDAAGNLEAAPESPDARTTVDTAPPARPTLASLPVYTAGTTLSLGWSDEAATGAAAYAVEAATTPDFASLAAASGWIAATSHAFAGLTDGQVYHVRVRARDAAGNETAFSAPRTTTMDATPPASSLEPLAAIQMQSQLALAWSGSDATSGLANADIYFSKDGGPFTIVPGSPFASSPVAFDAALAGGDGRYAFYTRARDRAGNVEAAPAVPDAQTLVDTTPPDVPALAVLPAYTAGTAVVASWSSAAASGAIAYLIEMAASADFAAIEATSGWIPNISFVFNGLADARTYWFRVKSRDAALYESAFAPAVTTTMDDTPPASAVSALPALTTTASFPLAWTATDATSGVAGVDLYFARDGGAYVPYPGGPFASSPILFDTARTGGEGQYAFYTRAVDAVGNREPAPAGPDAHTLVSTRAVGMPILASLPEFTMGTSRNLTWTAGANNASYLVQAAEDAAFSSIHAASGWIAATSHTFNGLADGTRYWYRIKGRSSAGVEGSFAAPVSSTQDAMPPQSQVAALPAVRNTQRFDIAWTASDATSGVASVDLWVSRNGGAYAAYPGGRFASSPVAFDAALVGGDGSYSFYTRAIDRAGNVEAAPAQPDAQTTIDSKAPAPPAMLPEPETTQGETNTVAWYPVADAVAYFAQCATDDQFMNVLVTTGWIPGTSYKFTGLVPGTRYYYRVRSRDAAGNASAYSAWVASTQSPGYILPAGWNLISFNVAPSNPRIDMALASIQGSYSIVRTFRDGGFRSYLPTLPLDWNDLTSVDAMHGYWVYMTRSDTLAVAGMPVAATTPISMAKGWNLVGYLPSEPMLPSSALASIASSLTLARTYEPSAGYRTYYPALPLLSDLTEMEPGSGYWMYMAEADVLVYGALPKASDLEAPGRGGRKLPLVAKGDGAAVPTVMDVWSTDVRLDGQPAPAGTVIEAYDASGTLCGSAELRQDGTLGILHLLGDVSITEEDEGAVPGETLTLRVRGLDAVLLGEGIVWAADAARAAKLEFATAASLLPRAFALEANHPNPFNPTTAIGYAIPGHHDGMPIEDTLVTLQVYDARGRIVRTLVQARQVPGRYTVTWDGRDERGLAAGSGVYFYRLQTDQVRKTRKMMLLK